MITQQEYKDFIEYGGRKDIPGIDSLIKAATSTIQAYLGHDEVTDDIKLAAKLLVRYYHKDEYNKTAMSISGSSVTLNQGSGLPPHVRAILDLHREL